MMVIEVVGASPSVAKSAARCGTIPAFSFVCHVAYGDDAAGKPSLSDCGTMKGLTIETSSCVCVHVHQGQLHEGGGGAMDPDPVDAKSPLVTA